MRRELDHPGYRTDHGRCRDRDASGPSPDPSPGAGHCSPETPVAQGDTGVPVLRCSGQARCRALPGRRTPPCDEQPRPFEACQAIS